MPPSNRTVLAAAALTAANAPPLNASVPGPLTLSVPLPPPPPPPPPIDSVPLPITQLPLLSLVGMPLAMLAVPTPAVLLTVPLLVKALVPPTLAKVVSPANSNVPALFTVPLLTLICPPVNLIRPVLLVPSVCALRFTMLPVVLSSTPLPTTVSVPPPPLIDPAVQVDAPLTVTVPAPPSAPAVRSRLTMLPPPSKLAVPPLMPVAPAAA